MVLPVELFGIIARYSERPTVCSLCLTSRLWHEAAARELYICVDLMAEVKIGFVWAVLSQPSLGSYVQSLDVKTLTLPSVMNGPDLFIQTLRMMPNLHHLGVKVVPVVDSTCEKALSSLTKIESFRAVSCTTVNMNRILSGLPPLRRFAWGEAGQHAREEPPVALLRSRDRLEYLDIHVFDFARFVRDSTVSFPRLQALSTTEGLDLAGLQGPGFASLAWIGARSFDSLSVLGQSYFLPRLRFMHAGISAQSCIFVPERASPEPRASPRRVLQHLAIEVSSIGGQSQVQQILSPEITIFENAEVRGLAMSMPFGSDFRLALCALKEIGATANLRMLSLKIASLPPDYTAPGLLAQLIEFATEGHFPNLRFIHLREEPLSHRYDGFLLPDQYAYKTAISSINESQAALAKALPSLEVIELILIAFATWIPTTAFRLKRRQPQSGHTSFVASLPVAKVEDVLAPGIGISASSKPDGKIAKLLQVILKPRKMAPVPLAAQRRIQTEIMPERLSDNGAWLIEEIDNYNAVPTPWSTLNNDVAQFLTVFDRYTSL